MAFNSYANSVSSLQRSEVEGYCADLRRSVRIYFLPDAEPMEVACPKVDAVVATNFDTALIESAIQQFQAGSCTYNEFCAKVMAAGCVGYFVSILDRRAPSRTASLKPSLTM
jgi:hypothetical protein